MRVNLVDVDKKWPNLALMKLSAWHKDQGHLVTLNDLKGDKNYVSCVFSKNSYDANLIADWLEAERGGPGFGSCCYKNVLLEEVEHSCPDYSLYPNVDYSMGFTSRGCIRKCDFCIVPEKEGKIKEWSALSEFVRHKKVKLLDNNFLASPNWEEKIREMIELNISVDFNQGLDIRLVSEKQAFLINKLNPPYLRFAWDNIALEERFFKGIKALSKAGYPITRNRVGVYVLVGFDSTIEEDIYRCERLHLMDINTHVQVYDPTNKEAKRLARWGNKPWIWTKCPKFENYKG